MGDNTTTITKVKVFRYDPEQRLLLVKGPVSGKRGAVVSIQAFGVKSWNHNNKKQSA
jgi:ribosomal protein L3